MKRNPFILVILAIALLVGPASFYSPADSAVSDQDMAPYIQFVEKQIKRDRVPALTIGFFRYDAGQGQMWVHSFGYADLENEVKASSDAAYRLASVSKMMTAAAVLQLAEKGKINLDAEVQTYVPYFPKKKWPVTVRQLLGHLGGISHYHDYSVEGSIKEHKSTREAIAIFENFDLVAEPGTEYAYTTYGYNLLGAVVEGASGQPFGEYMKQNVFAPAGMTHTRLDDPADLIPGRIRGYRLEAGEIKNSEFVDISSRLGGGGLRSTIPDLLQFAIGINRAKLLSEASRDLMLTSMATRDGHWTEYGMGWGVGSLHGRQFYSHTGSQQETRTLIYNFPSRGLIIAAALNLEDVSPGLYSRRLFQFLEKEPWSAAVYSGDATRDSVIRVMQSVLDSGMTWYDLHGKAMSEDPARLNAAFRYVNDSMQEKNLRQHPAETQKMIEEGIHPAAREPYTVAGAFMAAKLAEAGMDPLRKYPRLGAIPFFNDFIQVYKSDRSIAKENRFAAEFEKKMKTWNASWMRTQTEMTQDLWITADTDFQNLNAPLKGLFGKSGIYPDYTSQFADAIFDLIVSGEAERADQAAVLASDLYPQSDRAATWMGIAALASNDKEKALVALKKSVTLNKDGSASADELNDLSYEFVLYGKSPLSVDLLTLATEMYPGNDTLKKKLSELQSVK